MSLHDYGYPSVDGVSAGSETTEITARVSAVHKELYEVVTDFGFCHAKLKPSVYFNPTAADPNILFPTTGDYVSLLYNSSENHSLDDIYYITKTLGRKSYFTRRSPVPGRGEQAVAANFDYVFIMTSLNQDLSLRRLERYITSAWQSGGTPVIILTKADLTHDIDDIKSKIDFISAGIAVFAVSTVTGVGFDALTEYLKPRKTIVLLGSSGVGKSSFVNFLAGSKVMEVNAIREDDDEGRHTTTVRQLIRLPNGVVIIDTPGMRELGMWDVSGGLNKSFADVDDFLGKCKFTDCTHTNEPGCAVLKAIKDGLLTRERWNSYLALRKESEFAENKNDYLVKRTAFRKKLSQNNKMKNKYGVNKKHDYD